MQSQSLQDRVALLETDVRHHAKTLAEYADITGGYDKRIAALEDAERQREIREGKAEEREKRYAEIVAEIRKDTDEIRNSASRLVWLVVIAVVGASVTWVLKGNLLQ